MRKLSDLAVASLLLLLAGLPLPAQDAGLPELVEAYLSAVGEGEAATALEKILATKPEATALLAALRDSPPRAEDFSFDLPHLGQALRVEVHLPEKRTGDSLGAPPVLFDISGHFMAEWLRPAGAVTCWIRGYTPPEFSDEGRDGFLKALRRVSHAVGGDASRLWLTGFSWAAHASWDTAMHRPEWIRGIAPFGGGPRRVHYRLRRNLRPTSVLSFCGGTDDPELLWNLREFARTAAKDRIDYHFSEDPTKGHTMPLLGYEGVWPAMDVAAPAAPKEGQILADGPLVESPILRIDAVDERRTKVPARIPVSARLSPDEQRRATIQAMEKAVARLSWKLSEKDGIARLELGAEGIEALTVLCRCDRFQVGQRLQVLVGRKVVVDQTLAIDARAMLEDARRTGERQRPLIRSFAVKP